MKTDTRIRGALICNICIVLMVLIAWGVMLFANEEGVLSTLGFANLRYFTVLSNVFEGVASLLLVISLRRGGVSHGVFAAKYLAAVTVAVTFFVVALFFGPWIGYAPLYRSANFWFHLVIPLTAMLEFVFWDRFDIISRREVFLAPLPALVYGVVYAAALIFLGGEDFYGFAHWGLPVGFGIFAGILLLSLAAGALLRLGNRAGRR